MENVVNGQNMPGSVCTCDGQGECNAVASGSIDVTSDSIPAAIHIDGNLSPLPFESLNGAPESDLHCFTGKVVLQVQFAVTLEVVIMHFLVRSFERQGGWEK